MHFPLKVHNFLIMLRVPIRGTGVPWELLDGETASCVTFQPSLKQVLIANIDDV